MRLIGFSSRRSCHGVTDEVKFCGLMSFSAKLSRRAACPHAADCSKFRLDETLLSSTIIYRRCKSQYIRRSHFFGKDDRIAFYNAATYALAGKAAFAKRNIFACERDGFNLVAGRAHPRQRILPKRRNCCFF